jgi:hypothetical protein
MLEHDEAARASKGASGKKNKKKTDFCPPPTVEETPKFEEQENPKLLRQHYWGKPTEPPRRAAKTTLVSALGAAAAASCAPFSKLSGATKSGPSEWKEESVTEGADEGEDSFEVASSWQQQRRHRRKAKGQAAGLTTSSTCADQLVQKPIETEAPQQLGQSSTVDATESIPEPARDAADCTTPNVDAVVVPSTPPVSHISPPDSTRLADNKSAHSDAVLVRGRYVSMQPWPEGSHVEGAGNEEDHGPLSETSIPGTRASSQDPSRGIQWQPGQLVNYIWGCTSQFSNHELEQSPRSSPERRKVGDPNIHLSEQITEPPSADSFGHERWSRATTPSSASSSLGTPFRHGRWVAGCTPSSNDMTPTMRAVQRNTFIDIDVGSSPTVGLRKSRSMSPRKCSTNESVNYDGAFDEGQHWYFSWH